MTTQPPRPARGSGPSTSGGTRTSRRARERARRRRRNRRILITVAVLAVLALLGGGFLLTRSDDDGGGESAQTATRPTTGTTGGTTGTTGASTPPTTGTTATTEARPGGPCKPDNLTAAVVTSAVRANGSVRVITLTNTGRKSCTLTGYPGLELTGLEGEALTVQVAQGGGAVPVELTAQTVTVQPGGRASFVMAWDRGGSCQSAQSLGIVVPEAPSPVPLESFQSVCGNGTVYVSPFQPDVASA